LSDSFQRLSGVRGKDFLKRIHVTFQGEPGIDAGGVSRDWFTNLVKAIFNPNYALFIPTANGRASQPNPMSRSLHKYLAFFKFTGHVIARAVIEGIAIDAHLSRSLLKCLLGSKMSLRDLEDIDRDEYDSLIYLLEHDAASCGLTFSIDVDNFGRHEAKSLVPNGVNIEVTDENKREYVEKIVEHRLTGQVSEQIQHFVDGFYELIPRTELRMFQTDELDLLICGVPEIDVDDFRANCHFARPYNQGHEVIARFFNVLVEFSPEDRAKFLMFLTGSSQVPFGGFKALEEVGRPIRIAPGGDPERLPQAHTCVNQLDLPAYASEEVMKEKLLLAIQNCDSFGFA
jgi:E3 ubiquitin-protein ligase HUWE1